jgi:hypothetical protein
MSGLQVLRISNLSSVATGEVLDAWRNMSCLRRLELRNVSLGYGALSPATLPASWATNWTRLMALVLEGVSGLSGSLPGTWLSGFPNLTTLHLTALAGPGVVPGVSVGLADVATLLANKANRSLVSLSLEGLGLAGTLPAALLSHTRCTWGAGHARSSHHVHGSPGAAMGCSADCRALCVAKHWQAGAAVAGQQLAARRRSCLQLVGAAKPACRQPLAQPALGLNPAGLGRLPTQGQH